MTAPPPVSGLLAVALAAEDENFARRIRAAMFQLSTEVLLGAAEEGIAADRRSYIAEQVAANPDLYVKQFTWVAAATPQVRDTVSVTAEGEVMVTASDATILAIARATWDTIANR